MIFVGISGQFSLLGEQKPLGFYMSAPNYSAPESASSSLIYKPFFDQRIIRKKTDGWLFDFVFKVVCI